MAERASWLAAVRPRPDWLPRSSVGLGVAATVAMNVAAGGRGGLGGALVGAMVPVGFVVSLETLIFMVRRLARLPWGWAWCLGAGLPLAGLAGITGVISYLHALTVAEWTGDTAEAGLALTEHLIPLVADLMIVTGSVALVALAVAAKHPAPAGQRAGSQWSASRKRAAIRAARPPDRRQQTVGELEQIIRDALAAGNTTERTLQKAVAEAGYPQFTRWAAGKALKAAGSNGHGPG